MYLRSTEVYIYEIYRSFDDVIHLRSPACGSRPPRVILAKNPSSRYRGHINQAKYSPLITSAGNSKFDVSSSADRPCMKSGSRTVRKSCASKSSIDFSSS